ncbi:MAG: chloride channel protein [Acidobacteria bacterium]|nr:chloride channel protein [Acidobacteriota bacterium]
MESPRGSRFPEPLRQTGFWLRQRFVTGVQWCAVRLPLWRWAKVLWRVSFLPEQNYLIILAVVVGILTGLGSVGFIYLIEEIAAFARGPVASLLDLFGPANLLLLPALGGLIAGPLIHRFAREARGHGVPEVMTALATRGGRIRKRVAAIKVITSSLTIGFGGTAGREGPMVQIGSAIGSAVATWTRLDPDRVRTLVTCGAAGGVAATFNAPIAGAIFAMEVLIGRVRTDFLLVLLTSLSSCMVARSYLGNYPAFTAPDYDLVSGGELPLYFIMGLLLGWAAMLYVRALYKTEDLFGAWRFPDYLKPAVGGLMAGLVLRYFPEVYGAGFPAVEAALWVRLPWELLLGLFVAELVANCATLGSGGSGGVFAPSLYMGAMLGGAFGSLIHVVFPESTAGSGAYAMVGMAAFFAATAKAPATSILILFEMTNDYRIMLPLMAATVASVYQSHRMSPFSVYTLKLHRRGVSYPGQEEAERAAQQMAAPQGSRS